MDNKGLIFTLDSFLALIPIFIIIVAVSNVSDSELIFPSQNVRSIHDAQDTLEIMTHPNGLESTALQDITSALIESNNSDDGVQKASEIAGPYLNKTLGNSKYSLNEINPLNKTIISNGDMKNAKDVSVGFKSSGDYIFKLYLWN
ncbi:MAG TPA: hypothetical protein VK426_11575 [Methanobacterium sp.]|nr:hypothetical protein [Methanobacterium sp.]